MRDFVPALIVLVLFAVTLRDDTVLTLFYLMAAAYFASRWWSSRALKKVTVKRAFSERAFPGEAVAVRVEIANHSWLPVVWLWLRDSIPAEVRGQRELQAVLSLGPRGHAQFDYELKPYKRGYYKVGPLFLGSGDLLGLSDDKQMEGAPDHLTVYPRIVPLTSLGLPSRFPLGTLPHPQPIFEDPARVIGKREYVSGDSLRRVDWKATAASGRLQVKQFEPSIALATAIFLDLNADTYDLRTRFDAAELGIVVAASVASRVISQKQTVGLITNGADPLGGGQAQAVPPRKGRGHLMRLLEVLARIQIAERATPLPQLLRQAVVNLPWGTTLVLIAGKVDEPLFDALFQAQRAGMNAMLTLTAPASDFERMQRRMKHFGFPVYQIVRERDLDGWRR